MDIKLLAVELESFAERRWKAVVPLITQHHCGDLLEVLDGITDADDYSRRLHNNTQRIQRAFRNDTANYRQQARELAPAIRAAMDAEKAKREDRYSRAAIANKECIEATSAVLTGEPQEVVHQETIEAIDALAKLAGVKVHIIYAQQRAA